MVPTGSIVLSPGHHRPECFAAGLTCASVVFESMQTSYPDGVASNFSFCGADLAKPMWCYPDLGSHVIYLSDIINRTLTEQMREESIYLRRHAQARAAVKEIVEMPVIIRSIESCVRSGRTQVSSATCSRRKYLYFESPACGRPSLKPRRGFG